ncbi:vWA domain-containing protein [Mycobacterium avium]|uniref:vWA domain-containing protein n=1 Tax=Mycobacterium avium TaxID=1764 RepID=UPI000A03FA05|nr:VWA-like domain-containing protein [Mycobacterium avium]
MKVRELTSVERQAFQVVRLIACEAMPYYSAGLFSLQPVAAPGLNTFAVDKYWRLYLDPERLIGDDKWSPLVAGGVLLHEIGHLLRSHADRADTLRQPVNHEAWNFAGDAEINDDLVSAGVVLPDGVVTPEAIGCTPGGIAEDYYAALTDDETNAANGGAGCGDATADGEASCGSGSGAGPVPGELGADDLVYGRAGIDAPTGDLVRRKIAEAVRDAAASGIGTLPGGLRRWAEGVLAPPVVPWNKVLRSAVRRSLAEAAGRTDYSYRRPSRRRVPGVVLPAMRGPKVSVAIVVDTSGSMSGADLAAALSETAGVLRSAGVAGERVQVLTCDAASGQAQKVRRVADVVLTGGGGTDMRVGITAAEALRPRPEIVVVFSDGDTPWPRVPGKSKLVCVIIGSPENATRTPRFAVTVTVPTGVGS